MGRARRAVCQVLYNGIEVGLSGRLKSLSYTDNACGVSDEISLCFEERDAAWIRDNLKPEKGADLDVTVWFLDWKRSGDRLRYHCGNFTLDDMTYSAPPRQCVLKGVSIPAGDKFKCEKVSKVWGNVTLKQIAEEFRKKYGMKDLFYWGEEPVIQDVEQKAEPDSTFLNRMCEKQGLSLKVYKLALVIFDKRWYENGSETGNIIATFHEGDMEDGYSWNTTLEGTYTGASLGYTDGKKKETILVTVGEGPRILQLEEKADSEAEALIFAKARVNLANEKMTTLSFSAMGNPDIVATCNINIEGMGAMDGWYAVDKVTHTIAGQHKMKVHAYKIFKRI